MKKNECQNVMYIQMITAKLHFCTFTLKHFEEFKSFLTFNISEQEIFWNAWNVECLNKMIHHILKLRCHCL